MKDGRTHLAHKAEHTVDMDTGAVVSVTLQRADLGDTETVKATLDEARENLHTIAAHPEARRHLEPTREVVLDKGYHSNDTARDLQEDGLRTYISEPRRGRRKWEGKTKERDAVYANRRRIRGAHGKKLLRKRGELTERSFAHCYETGAMRRTHLRYHENILKRLLIHVGAFNLSLIFRRAIGFGTSRGVQERLQKAKKTTGDAFGQGLRAITRTVLAPVRSWHVPNIPTTSTTHPWRSLTDCLQEEAFATGC